VNIYTPWIQKWLRRTMSDAEMVAALEQAGVEVEQFSSSKPIDKKVIVALVNKVVQHPAADRLRLVFVSTGEREVRVVCGAPNVKVGMKVALAQVGTTLPSGDKIAAAKLRGELSEGMLCSERELEIGPDHDGILELPATAVPGARLCDMYPGGAIVDVKTQANRFDLLSVVGLAREIAAMSGNELKPLPKPLGESTAPKQPAKAIVRADAQAAQFSIARMKVASTAPSPDWMAAALQAAGVRSISPVVDVTNYVNLELGQPLHAYDAAKVKLPLEARFARDGETIVTLDGVKRQLSHLDLVIADADGPVGLAGLMGGARTEVSDKTTEILLEAATFDGATIRKMAKRHGLRTEASARFERGLPVQLAPIALARATQLLEDVAAAKFQDWTHQLNVWPWEQRIGLRHSLLTRLLGFEVSVKEAIETLGRLEVEARLFDIVAEARTFVGRPYKLGASYKTDGTNAFDCSYLTDYLYSLIGLSIGHTAHQQYKAGRPLELDELQPGDLLFCGGEWSQLDAKEREGVAHVALYIGDGKIIQAASKAGKITEEPATVITEHSEYLGARRYADDLADFLTVPAVPWWRPDLKEAQDLVEEVVRVVGYDRVPVKIPAWAPREVTFDAFRPKLRQLQRLLYGAGLFEVMTYSFVSEDQLADTGLVAKAHLKLKNPLSSEQAYLRSTLLSSHLGVLARNRMYAKSVAFYELSKVFGKRGAGEQPDEPLKLGITLRRPEEAYCYLKGILDVLGEELQLDVQVVPAEAAGVVYAPGRAGVVKMGRTELGWIGQLDPDLLMGSKLTGEVAYLELDAGLLLEQAKPRVFTALERFPSMRRDVAVVLPETVTWHEVASALANISRTRITFVSDYYGDDLPAGHKSLALRLTISHADRTPTEAEAADVERKVLAILNRKFKAVARS